MTPSPRELASFWVGFGAALRGVVGDTFSDSELAGAIVDQVEAAWPSSLEEFTALLRELPQKPPREIWNRVLQIHNGVRP